MPKVMRTMSLLELHIEDEASFRHVAIYADLKAALRRHDAKFCVDDAAELLNLAFWRPAGVAEVLRDEVISADQVAHNAWHVVAAAALGDAAQSKEGLLLAESIASAFDIYMTGRLLGHSPDALFLTTQIPAMREAAELAGFEERQFTALLTAASDEPEKSFEQLRQLLFDVSTELVACDGIDDAARIMQQAAEHPFAPLLDHYELPTWVLFARAYGHDASADVRAIDRELRNADDSVAWLERWLV